MLVSLDNLRIMVLSYLDLFFSHNIVFVNLIKLIKNKKITYLK